MKLIYKKLEKENGKIKLECQDSQDFFHVYNLLLKGDILTATALRQATLMLSIGSNCA